MHSQVFENIRIRNLVAPASLIVLERRFFLFIAPGTVHLLLVAVHTQ
jgi:hypothetical protein